MIKKILDIFSKKERFIFLKLISVMIIGVLLEMLSIGVIFPFLSTLLYPENTLEILKVYNFKFISNINSNNLIYISLFLVVILFVIKNFSLFFLQKYQARVMAIYNENLSNEIYKKYLDQPLKNIMQYNTSILSRNIIEVTNLFSNNFLQSLLNIILELTLLCGVLFILFKTQPYFMITGILIILPVIFLIYKFNKIRLLAAGEKSKYHWGERLKKFNKLFLEF